jgi:ectoine hydroxylase-related dioxygenase (phytanoyl-CoA dioxygenase family)
MTTATLSAEQIETYDRDGVVLVRDVVDPEWLERLMARVERIVDQPSQWASDTGEQEGEDSGRALDERYLWRDNDEVHRFVFDSGVANLVGQAMQTTALRFYFDHWFVKEPGTMTETPWHQDAPYWPFTGQQIASLWLALSPVDRNGSGLEFVKGSHRWNKAYKPQRFVKSDPKTDWLRKAEASDGEEIPDISGNRSDYDIFCEPMAPGDGLIFSAWMIHAAPHNRSASRRAAVSTRWLGDDVRWNPHPQADPTVRQTDVSIQPGELATDDDRFPVAWRTPVLKNGENVRAEDP